MKRTAGLLRVSRVNPRYFEDSSTNKIVYLTGTHTWNNFQEQGALLSNFDFGRYLDFMEDNNMNFIRLWAWENPTWGPWSSDENYRVYPMPYMRTGSGTALDSEPRFDLNSWNQEYFDRLKSRIEQAGLRGIYVGVMLFSGCSIGNRDWPKTDADTGLPVKNPWDSHPFNRNNNVNGIDGDEKNEGQGWELRNVRQTQILERQKAYVRKVIDEINHFDNVLYEIANEDPFDTWEWQYEIINYIKSYEAAKPKRHPVGMTASWKQPNELMFKSPADWISPYYNEGEAITPFEFQGDKVWLADTDHVFPNMGVTMDFAWKAFLRGANIISMDNRKAGEAWDYFVRKASGNVEKYEPNRKESLSGGIFEATLGDLSQKYISHYAGIMNLEKAVVSSSLSTTTYCMADPGREYLVFQPGEGPFSVYITGSSSEFSVEWLNPVTGEIFKGNKIEAGRDSQVFNPEFSPAVLYLKAE